MSTKPRVISIVDCFVHDLTVENNLRECLTKLKNNGEEVLLVSNTKIKNDILDLADYYFYDKRNQLFQRSYDGVEDVDFWNEYEAFKVHNIKSGLQKHGLSVLINLFNSLELAKSLGYTHFQRFETDDILGVRSLEWIRKVPLEVEANLAKGLFYTNPNNTPADASFHYFYCEINFFLENFKNIKSEEDYIQYLIESQGNLNFKIVEIFLYDHILKATKDGTSGSLLIKEGSTHMRDDFPDTVWNTVSSASNLPEKYRGCVTGIYLAFSPSGSQQDFLYLYSHNYSNAQINRQIEVIVDDNNYPIRVDHNLIGKGAWCLNVIPKNTSQILVYEQDILIFSESSVGIKSYIENK